MTNEALQFVSGFLSNVWQFFTGWYLPGTNITPASLAIFLIIVGITIRFARTLSGMYSSGSFDYKLPDKGDK